MAMVHQQRKLVHRHTAKSLNTFHNYYIQYVFLVYLTLSSSVRTTDHRLTGRKQETGPVHAERKIR